MAGFGDGDGAGRDWATSTVVVAVPHTLAAAISAAAHTQADDVESRIARYLTRPHRAP
jgi:hypothetical protein